MEVDSMTVDRSSLSQCDQESRILARWAPETQGIARMILGFLIFRHGMEQVLGFPAAGTDAPTTSAYGALKVLCFPGGLLLMLGLLTKPMAVALALAHAFYWLIEPLPSAVFEGARLFGARGAPSDHLLLPAFFCAYLFFAGPGAWSIDRWLRRDTGLVVNPRAAACSLAALRIAAGILFFFHGTGKIAPTLDPISLDGLALVLEVVGGVMMVLGLFTRPLAFVLSGEMAFAYFITHAPNGFWGSFARPNQEAAIQFCFLYLFLWTAGPGALSVDAVLQQRRDRLVSPHVGARASA